MKYQLPQDSKMLSKKEFTFGVATAAFQIEGANTKDGRCESIWDRFCATPGKVLNGDDGTQACDHYHRWQEDLDLIAALGVDAYRFSIAWPRIEPTSGSWNKKGFDFYERLVDGMLDRGIKPYCTLYHWDLPQYLEDNGGWLNRDTAHRFAEYADRVTQVLGDRVASYATFNEPWCAAYLGYRTGMHAPGHQTVAGGFKAIHHILLASGLALPAMRENAPGASHGIVLNFSPGYAYDANDAEDVNAAKEHDEEHTHGYIKPILEGQYPEGLYQRYESEMIQPEEGDMEIISRPIDYLGINFYNRTILKANKPDDFNVFPEDAEFTDFDWEIYPDSLRYLLNDLNNTYPNLPPIIITENGAACADSIDESGKCHDDQRCRYYNSHLNAVDGAIKDGVNVRGYFGWSLLDNFEWAAGYSKRFGMTYVDYETQERTPKSSYYLYQELMKERD